MKTKKLFILLAFSVSQALGQKTTEKITVHGNCNMCKKNIEEAAIAGGAKLAKWNKKKQTLTMVFDASSTEVPAIKKSIAAKGYDVEGYPADDAVYNQLPACCRYRK